MTTVMLYLGHARFDGPVEFDWESPALGSTHRFILFLAQEAAISEQELALKEVERYGFRNIELGEGRPIVVESLNDPAMAAFRKHYEGAFSEGATLVWYP